MKISTAIKTIGRIALYGLAFIGVAVVAVLGTAIVKQHAKDKQFVQEELLPLATHIEQFRMKSGRLPTDEEFEAWYRNNPQMPARLYFSHKPDFCSSWGEDGKAFLVGAWRGEWFEYYQSWDKKTFSEEYMGAEQGGPGYRRQGAPQPDP